MDIEIKVDEKYTKPKILIYTNKINEEIKATSDKFLVEHPWKGMLIMFINISAIGFVFPLLNSNIFSKNISTMNVISFMILLIIFTIYKFIKAIIESNIIKEINQKLKERKE